MESRVFNRKNLLGFSMIVLFYHLAMTIIPWFVYSWPMFIADYILLGLASAGWLLYFGWARGDSGPESSVPSGPSAQKVGRRGQWAGFLRPLRPSGPILVLVGFLVWLVVSCVVMTVRWDNDWVGYNFIPTMASPTSPGFNAAVTI